MKKIALLLFTFGLLLELQSQVVLLDENFSNGIPSNWTTFDVDQLSPKSDVSNFVDAWIGFNTATDTCAASTSYYEVGTDTVSLSQDFLITPPLNLLSFGNVLTWDAKSFDANHPEKYYVLLSTTDSLPDSFTDTLKVIENVQPYWGTKKINLYTKGHFNKRVYVAFRNASTDKYILGIDNVKMTADDPASISSVEKIEVLVHPNPVMDNLNIEAENFIGYKIFNITGKQIGIGFEKNINVSHLNKGVYFVYVETENGDLTQKIVKL